MKNTDKKRKRPAEPFTFYFNSLCNCDETDIGNVAVVFHIQTSVGCFAIVKNVEKAPIERLTYEVDPTKLCKNGTLELWTVKLTAKKYGKHISTIYRWIREGKLFYTYQNSRLMVVPYLEAYIVDSSFKVLRKP